MRGSAASSAEGCTNRHSLSSMGIREYAQQLGSNWTQGLLNPMPARLIPASARFLYDIGVPRRCQSPSSPYPTHRCAKSPHLNPASLSQTLQAVGPALFEQAPRQAKPSGSCPRLDGSLVHSVSQHRQGMRCGSAETPFGCRLGQRIPEYRWPVRLTVCGGGSAR